MATRTFENGSINIQIGGTFKNTDATIAIGNMTLAEIFAATIANGTGADMADRVYYARIALSTTPNDLDLASGALLDIFGNALTFARIKAIYIKNRSTTAGEIVTVGGDSNGLVGWVGAANDLVNIRPGGVFCIYAPDATAYAVTAGTGDILQMVAAAGTPSIDLVLIGASA